MRQIFDGHCHIDPQGGCDASLTYLHREAEACGITGILLNNIPGPQFGGVVGFENEQVLEKAAAHGGFFRVFPCINPSQEHAVDLVAIYKRHGAAGIKLHPRLHKFHVDGEACRAILREAGRLGLPTLICGFSDGLNLALGNTPEAFGRLALACPAARFAIGHACGHHILDAMMLAKAFDNIHLDLSFTPLYYRGSSVVNDIAYAIRSIKGRKTFWGTDFPDRPYAQTVEMSEKVFAEMNLDEPLLDKLFCSNIIDFLEGQHA